MSAINDITEAWAGHSGLEVETWLKNIIASTVASLGGKIGHVELVGSTLNFYEEQGGNIINTITLSGDVYTISTVSNCDQIFYVLSGETQKILTFTPSTTVSPFGSQESQPFPESYSYVVAVNNGNGYIPRATGSISPGGTGSVDIRPFLANGDNYIRVTVTGDTSAQVKTSVFTGVLTSLTLSINHAWQNVWNEGSDYTISGIRFAGNLVKTLHCSIDDVELDPPVIYTANQSYTTTATTYTIPSSAFPASSGNGTHEVKLWMTAQGVSTPEFIYNILCVATGDTTPMVTINAITPTVVNWTNGKLFSYAVYNADKAEFDLSALLGGTSYTVANDVAVLNLSDGQIYDFNYSVEIDTGVNETPTGTFTITGTASFESTVGESITVTTALDNTYSYLATPGALFYMNASVRSNNESNRETIFNEMGASLDNRFAASYPATWSGFAWNGDGWDKDEDGYRALHIPAGCSIEVPTLAPFDYISAYPEGMTFEVMIKNEYPADYETPILSLGTEGDSPVGLFIYPTKIVVLGTYERSLVNQTVNISENRMTHLTVTFVKGYEGHVGRNLVSIYVNGISNVNFSFDASTSFGNAYLKLGQNDADTFIYRMRIYGTALDSKSVFNNFLNSIIDGVEFHRYERSLKNDIFEGAEVNYDKVKAAGYNIMVIKLTNDQIPLPSVDHPAPSDGYPNSQIRFEYADDFNKNVTVNNVSIDGQGTTSMKYYRWNIRAKTNSSTLWEYGDDTEETGKKGRIINDLSYIKVDRITAKKNYASSMQGHKMGFTNLYNDLFKECGLGGHLPSSEYRVAVFQFPFVGFRYYEANDTYEYIGIYTVGPDKGSKTTFGYSDSYMSLLSLEGPNHAPRGTRFLHPWCDITYDPEQETLCYGGEEGWDVDYVNYESSTKGTQADWDAIMNLYEVEWRPAYECVYNNSPHIASIAEVIAAIDDPNITTLADVIDPNNVRTVTATTIPGYTVPVGVMEFYDTNYERWFFRTKTGQFERIVDVNNTLEHNLLTDLSDYLTTQTPTTAQIIAARAARFKATVSSYWDVDQTLFHYCFCELYAVSDNFAKNSYPFKFLPFSELGARNRWGWRQDDMDTVLMTDNNGNNTKSYSVEPGDLHDGVQIFQGYNSALWTLIHDNYQDELRTMMISIVTAASSLAVIKNVSGDGLHGSLFNLTSLYCWENSAKYFSEQLYETDRRWSYIQPWLENPTKEYNSVLPLTQALGDQYQGERLWMERRIAYIFSKYKIGAFNGATEGYSELAFTLAQQFTFNLTPAIDLYPTASTGSTTVQGARTESRQTTQITLDTTGDTTNYIKAGDWLASLGDLSGMVMTARGGGDISFSVVCKRLLDLKIGDEDPSNVGFNADTFSVSSPSLTYIDARNTVTIRNMVNLMNCPRLRTVLFDGSGASGMLLPVGAKVTEVSFPKGASVLFLHSLPFLDNEHLSLPTLTGISSVYINSNVYINPMTIIQDILDQPGNNLEYVTAIWEGTMTANTFIIKTLASALNLTGNVTYENGSIANVQGNAYIEGVIDISEDANGVVIPPQLTISQDESYSGDYVRRMWISNFSTRLPIIYDERYIYPDPYVDDGWIWCYYNVTTTESATKLLSTNVASSFGTNFIIDGVEVPRTQTYQFSTTGEHLVKMQRSGNLPYGTFSGNTVPLKRIYIPSIITTLTNTSNNYVFASNTNLEYVYLPETMVDIQREAFRGCTNLKLVNLRLPNLRSLGFNAFRGCTNLNVVANFPALTTCGSGPFQASGIMRVLDLGTATSLPSSNNDGFCSSSQYIKEVVIPPTVTSIGGYGFANCPNLEKVTLDLPNLTTLAWSVFYNSPKLTGVVNFPSLQTAQERCFMNTSITEVKSLGYLTRLDYASNDGFFTGCTKLKKVRIPATMVGLDRSSFYNCTNLTEIIYDDIESITYVQTYAFYNCGYNGSVYFPKLATIQGRSFTGSKITSIENLGLITSIPGESNSGVFQDCTNLVSARLPKTLTSLGYDCFRNDSKLKTITCEATVPPTVGSGNSIPSTIQNIYVPFMCGDAYKEASVWTNYASKIQEMMPYDDGYIWAVYEVASTEADTSLFNSISGLSTTMSIDYGEEILTSTGYTFETTGKHLVKVKCTTDTLSAFYGQIRLSEVYLPSDLHKYSSIFNGCSGLKKIHFWGDVTSITGNNCFQQFPVESVNFEKWKVNASDYYGNFSGHHLSGIVEIPEGVTKPPLFTGANVSGLEDLTIILPSTTTSFTTGRFCQNVRNLVSVTCKATTPPTATDVLFLNCSNLTTIYVPQESVNAYKSASQWSAHAAKIEAIVEE